MLLLILLFVVLMISKYDYEYDIRIWFLILDYMVLVIMLREDRCGI